MYLIKTLKPLNFAGIGRGRNFFKEEEISEAQIVLVVTAQIFLNSCKEKLPPHIFSPTKQDFTNLFVPNSLPWALGERWNKFSYFCYFEKVEAHENSSNFDRFQLLQVHSTGGTTLRAINLTQKLGLQLTPRFYYGGRVKCADKGGKSKFRIDLK